MSQWQTVTAIYVIGNPQPIATFANQQMAEFWAESQFPGEWIKKQVKIPSLPLASKKAQRNLKGLASVLDSLEWTDDDDSKKLDEGSDKVIINPNR